MDLARILVFRLLEALGKEDGLSAYATSQGRITIKND